MNLVVFVKHVPDTAEADLAVASDGKSIRTAGLPFQMNEWDRFALEEAVQWKERTNGSLTAILLGDEEAEESLRRCLAVGADRAIRVWDPAVATAGPLAAAPLLRAALGDAPFDLILCGAQAADDGAAVVGPALAELLGIPCAALVNKLEIADGKAVCTRELEGGWGEVVELALPALATIQTGINEPRYVSILGIRKARSKPVEVVGLDGLGIGADALAEAGSHSQLVALEPPPAGREAELFSGSLEEMVKRFVSVLAEKGGVL